VDCGFVPNMSNTCHLFAGFLHILSLLSGVRVAADGDIHLIHQDHQGHPQGNLTLILTA
jgi:hypothetical protein